MLKACGCLPGRGLGLHRSPLYRLAVLIEKLGSVAAAEYDQRLDRHADGRWSHAERSSGKARHREHPSAPAGVSSFLTSVPP
jgi:hypothetical protein